MVSKPGWPGMLLCCLSVLIPTVSTGAATSSPPKQDRSWKLYRNRQLGYCLSYPSRWFRGDAFDGAGFYVETGLKKYSRPLGEIDVGVVPPLPKDAPHTAAVSLVENLQIHLNGLKTFERAERMEVLEKRSMEFLGNAALLTRDRYYDPQDRSTWIDEVIFVSRKDNLFRFELECRADQFARFESVWNRLLSSFQFECGSGR